MNIFTKVLDALFGLPNDWALDLHFEDEDSLPEPGNTTDSYITILQK